MTYGLKDVAREFLHGDLQYTSIVGKEQRQAICKACPDLRRIVGTRLGQCTKCGCFMDAKVLLRKAECPLGKWKAE